MKLLEEIIKLEEMKRLDEIVLYINLASTAIGIVNNIISITVFLQKTLLKRKFNWYLLVLAIIESIFCLTVFIDNIFVQIHKKKIFLHELNNIGHIVINYIIHTTDSCSSILTLLLSLDRLYAIKFPLQIKQFITNLHAKKLMIITLTIVVSLNSISLSLCEIYSDSKPFIVYCSLISPLLFNGIPLVVIAFLNGLLAKEMIKKITSSTQPACVIDASMTNLSKDNVLKSNSRITLRKFQKKTESKKQKSHYIVILLLSIWSILTSFPYYFLKTYNSLFNLKFISKSFDLQTVVKSQIISSIFFNLNHCLNFLFYFIFYSEFRNILFCQKVKPLISATSNMNLKRSSD
jgi:hypothetical protein